MNDSKTGGVHVRSVNTEGGSAFNKSKESKFSVRSNSPAARVEMLSKDVELVQTQLVLERPTLEQPCNSKRSALSGLMEDWEGWVLVPNSGDAGDTEESEVILDPELEVISNPDSIWGTGTISDSD